jgi:AAA domain, putative AbiEii toxin, Type IV TA system
MFDMYVVDEAGTTHEPGSVKIGEVGLQPRGGGEPLQEGYRVPTLPRTFKGLDKLHFSVGQSENYYETLSALDPTFKQEILVGLRDCAFDLTVFEANLAEEVMSESLLRSVPQQNVRNRFHRLAHGDAVLTRFEFEYALPNPNSEGIDPPVLTFDVVPASEPPTNVHVLIGRNGVGKTRCVQHLSMTVLGVADPHQSHGELRPLGDNANEWSFAGLVSVSFSVFDDFDLPTSESSKIRATQVGLRHRDGAGPEEAAQVKTPERLAEDFTASLAHCRSGPRSTRWLAAVETLETDPLFEEADVGQLLTLTDDEWQVAAMRLFRRLSSGHAIVLLTMTRLVELVDERTLVILDEPEGHLHPPLLAAFVRSVADLLVKRNGVGLIATHSPVVLQEVPRSCVWKLRRAGEVAVAERPLIETFGENVGVLTREVFGLEVTKSGFHNLLRKALLATGSYEAAVAHFDDQLGAEARAVLMALASTPQRLDEGSDEDLA